VVFKYFKTFEKDSIASGAEYSDTWDLDEDLVIKRILLVEKAGGSLLKSSLYLKIKDRVYTLPVVSANVLTPSISKDIVFDIPAAKGEKLAFTFRNGEASAVSIVLSFECWSP